MDIVGIYSVYLCIVVPICLIYGLCIIFKKIDPILKEKPFMFDTKLPVQSDLIRLNAYMTCIISGKRIMRKSNPFKDAYGDFDFKAHATLLDKIVCYLYFGSFLVGFLLVIGQFIGSHI